MLSQANSLVSWLVPRLRYPAVAFEIVQAVRDDDAGAEAGEIAIPNLLRLLNVELAVAIEKAH